MNFSNARAFDRQAHTANVERTPAYPSLVLLLLMSVFILTQLKTRASSSGYEDASRNVGARTLVRRGCTDRIGEHSGQKHITTHIKKHPTNALRSNLLPDIARHTRLFGIASRRSTPDSL